MVFVIVGIAFLGIVFNPNGLLISFDNRPLFLSIIFAVGVIIGFGTWLFSGFPLKMFLEPFVIITLWTFAFVLPVLLLPLSTDVLSLILSFSLLILVLLYGNYIKWREKRKRELKGEAEYV